MSITRRAFIKGTLVTSLAVSCESGCGNDVTPAPPLDVEVNDDPSSMSYGRITVPESAYPPTGAALTLRIAPLPPGARPFLVPPHGILLVRIGTELSQTEFIATRADCPHQGCSLGYSAQDRLIECPCHSSRFVAVADPRMCTGRVVRAPARTSLTTYTVGNTPKVDGIEIDLRHAKTCEEVPMPAVVDGVVHLPFADFPQLAQVGGSVVGEPEGLDDTILVARVAANRVVCVSAICTHEGVNVALDGDHLRCPLHGSEFGFDGAVLEGPATKALKPYVPRLDGDTVVITVA